ncbi:Purple acid [Nesidiocoris tenuis]|uniref:Purple acid phosphatase n=1 Tax=Nesidiocoris tenuis TaxID=355587 RepID=A0ABN7AD23_9HEMI|nr:Purple acid [Nesidiocoris tenuis]
MWESASCFFKLLVVVSLGVVVAIEAKKSIAPEQIHLSYGDDDLQLVVTWTTFSPTPTPTVFYGTGAQKNLTAEGVSRLFVDGGHKKRKEYMHRVLLTGLQPDTKYKYICGSNAGWSGEFWFRTAPAKDWSPRIAIVGDLGSVNGVSIETIARRTQLGIYDAVIHIGDIAYDMSDNNGKVGDEFLNEVQPIASHVPYMVCPGNHEYHYNFSQYREKFTMPGNTENLFYSYNIGPAHFVSISTEGYFFTEYYGNDFLQRQYDWIVEDLKEANKNRKERPWIILYGHRPMYCSAVSYECERDTPVRSGVTIRGEKEKKFGLEKLLNLYGVDLVFWGHQHNYERFWPVYNYQVKNGTKGAYIDPKATVHIITGSGGSDELIEPFRPVALPSSAFRSMHYSYTELNILNGTHVNLRQIATDDASNTVVDNVMIVKNWHGPYQ